MIVIGPIVRAAVLSRQSVLEKVNKLTDNS
jgi:hypothetical protein